VEGKDGEVNRVLLKGGEDHRDQWEEASPLKDLEEALWEECFPQV